jgi:hypothetical protein
MLLCSCKSKNQEDRQQEEIYGDNDKYYQFSELNLTAYGFNATIKIPDETTGIGASFEPIVRHEEDFKWVISAGPNFNVFIEDYGDFSTLMNDFKQKINSSDFFTITIMSEKNGVISYSRKIKDNKLDQNKELDQTTYHIYASKKLGNVNYEIKNREEGNTLKVIQLMEKSIASLKIIK